MGVIDFNKKVSGKFIFLVGFILILTVFLFAFRITYSEKTSSSIWDGSIASSFSSGDGSSLNPYVINDGSELALFFSKINSDDSSDYYNKFYVLNNNIDLDGRDFSFSKEGKIFSGSFDGQGYSIINFKIENYYETDHSYNYNLFGNVIGGTIKNVNISDSSIYIGYGSIELPIINEIDDSNIDLSNDESLDNEELSDDKTDETLTDEKLVDDESLDNEELSDDKVDETLDNENSSDENDNTLSSNENEVLIDDVSNENDSFETNKDNSNEKNVNISLFENVKDSNINNININNFSINYEESLSSINSSLFILNDDGGNKITNINSNCSSNLNDTFILFNKYKDSDVEMILYSEDKLKLSDVDFKSNSVYLYSLSFDDISFENTSLSDALSVLNSNSSIEWDFVNGKFKLINVGMDPVKKKVAALKAVSKSVSFHDSGVFDNVVYVNDLQADYDYYQALNYTELTSRTALPSYQNKYNNNTLALVNITYDGHDINDNSLVGYVSSSEQQNMFVYSKQYYVQNGYVDIELIDNPFAQRPNGKGFNGWVCNASSSDNNICRNSTMSIDMDYYVRHIRVPATGGATINIYLNASWINADIKTGTNVSFNDVSMQRVYPDQGGFTFDPSRDYAENTSYHVNNGQHMTGMLASNNTFVDENCNNWNGCDYYPIVYSARYGYTTATINYYWVYRTLDRNGQLVLVSELGNQNTNYFLPQGPNPNENDNLAGLFYLSDGGKNGNNLYYDNRGVNCANGGNCGSNGYKLIQTNDPTNKSNGTSISIASRNVSATIDRDRYYYLVTRDTNIMDLNGNINIGDLNNKNFPFTVTSYPSGTGIQNTINVNNNLSFNRDAVIENVILNTGGANTSQGVGQSIFANYQNIKIGRTTSYNGNNNSANNVFGGANDNRAHSNQNMRVMVEGGRYNTLTSASAATPAGTNMENIHGQFIYGSDYDRVNNNDSKLLIRIRAVSNSDSNGQGAGGNFTTSNGNDIVPCSQIIVKSGIYGYGASEGPYGLYVGGQYGQGRSTMLKTAIVQGGQIFNISGGSDAQANQNVVGIYITGGLVINGYGGATSSSTRGNRILAVSGGQVVESIAGGSNANGGNDNNAGDVNGNTLVYVGGKALIGGRAIAVSKLYNNINTGWLNNNAHHFGLTEDGLVLGAGLGKNGGGAQGSVANSTVIINGGTIEGAVYGGGNYGAVGVSNSINSSTTNIYIYDGNIVGSVFGGGNNNGSGTTSKNSTVNINMTGGTISGNLYGGSNVLGTIYGSVNVNVTDGEIAGSVYGGGQGNNTFIRDNVNVVIGNSSVGPTISSNVYGGSAFGTVNATSVSASNDPSKNTIVTINNGNILGSVFGGAKGSSSYVPYVKGNIIVNLNDGTVSNLFGGFDASGQPFNSNVYLNGGILGNGFGGGNNTSISESHIYLQGSTVSNLYGGSNQSGVASVTNVVVSSGTASNVYGGNNVGGETTTSNVLINGGTVSNVYGGNNQGGVNNTSNVTFSSGDVDVVYGGGNNANTSTTNVIVNSSLNTLFGGGNNASVVSSNVTLNSGNIVDVFGGGNNAGASTTNVEVSSSSTCNITNLYGGSNQNGDVNTTNVNVKSGFVSSLFGGNNRGGVSSNTNVVVDDGVITNLYGGGNLINVGSTNVVVNDGTITDIYGGGNQASVDFDTSLNILGGVVTHNIYGGGNDGETIGNSTVIINDGVINGSAYGGGNGSTATVYGNTSIYVGGNSVIGTDSCSVKSQCSLFGGGNAAFTGSSDVESSNSSVNVLGGTIYGNVYGGANTSVIYGGTAVNVGSTDNSIVSSGPILVKGTVFGGGEANANGSENYDWHFVGVTKSISVNVDGDGYSSFDILGSIFGSGNASTASGVSTININNYGSFSDPKRNISIQRTDLLVIDNSAIVLEGATDRTNEYSDVLFSLSIINELDLKNNSTLFLETGANELRCFKSLTSSGDLATVSLDDGLSRNVDNRVYMFGSGNKVLNIANDTLTTYGDVFGMTFFGLFKYGANDSIVVGMYDDYENGEYLGWGGNTFTSGSYVLGAHKVNHDYYVDGFYSNFIDDNGYNSIQYIEPSPADSPIYMWVIGEYVQTYNVDLSASKYSTLGAIELPLIDYTKPNTTFEILGVDFSELDESISLVNKNDIPKLASSSDIADTVMGLSIETSNSGFLSSGTTSFYTNSSNPVQGLTSYVGENSTGAPSLLFYLYHSKNLGSSGSLGTVQIIVRVVSRIDDLTTEPETLIINVNISRALYNTNDYEASLTAGRKYEMFTSTLTKITSNSSISAYFSLYAEDQNIYSNGYHRALVSNYALPADTKITMIDLSGNDPMYYYYTVTSDDYNSALSQIQFDGEADYSLSRFELMGAFNSGHYYDDSSMNSVYYDSLNNYSQEEFIFIIDFSDASFISDSLDNYILFELQNSSDETMVSVLGIQESNMHYDVYNNLDAVIDIEGTISDDTIYSGDTVTLDLVTSYTQSKINGNIIYDTGLFDNKMGLKLTLFNQNGEVVTGTSLLGLTYEINGVSYSPSIDGTTRIKISDRVGNAETWIKVKTGTSNIATGNYVLRVESFGSSDGYFYGLNTSDYVDFEIYIVNEIYGLDIVSTDEEMVINKTTGFNLNNSNVVTYDIAYNSGLANPSIRVKLLRRKYDSIYSSEYSLVDIKDYVLNNFVNTSNEKEYLVVANPLEETSFSLRFGTDLQPGTYMIEFMLYDNNSFIGSVERYIIIK